MVSSYSSQINSQGSQALRLLVIYWFEGKEQSKKCCVFLGSQVIVLGYIHYLDSEGAFEQPG